MADPARVCVVIPLYNGARYVEMAVRSALASNLHDLEVVVVDDGSTDGSAQIVSRIGDPRITLLQQHASGGPSRPRNVAIEHSRAPYIALLDADDLLKPHKLAAAVAALEAYPEAGFAFTEFEKIDALGAVVETSVIEEKLNECAMQRTPIGSGWSVISRHELERGFLYRNFIGTSGVVLRRSALNAVGTFDESLVFSEDLDLWFRLIHHCSALYGTEIGHSYRVADGSLTYQPGVRTAHDRIKVLRRERARRSNRAERRQVNRLIAETQASIGYQYRRSHQRFRAMGSFAQALVTCPDLRWMRALVGSLVS